MKKANDRSHDAMNHDDALTYQSTAALPDDEGKALLDELDSLWAATEFNDNGKKVRSGSDAERYAIAALRAAMINAAARFKRHEEFSAWLANNSREHIEAYDPLRCTSEQAAVIGNLQRDVADIKLGLDSLKHNSWSCSMSISS